MFDFTKCVIGVLLVSSAAVWLSTADASGALPVGAAVADLAGRIDYGFYADEPRVVQAARTALDRLPDSEPGKAYYQAYAAYRLARLGLARGSRALRSHVADCIEHASLSAEDADWAVEAWILVGACSLLGAREGSLKTIIHELRFEEALAEAKRLEPTHPRLLLLGAWAVAAGESGGSRAPARELAYARAIDGFAQRRAPLYGPDWGRAEALAGLAELHLENGSLREARDLIERALLEAPGFHFALQLQKELSLQR